MPKILFTQPWHFSEDGIKVRRASVGEVIDLSVKLYESAVRLGVGKPASGDSAPFEVATKADFAPHFQTETPQAEPTPAAIEPKPKRGRPKRKAE